MAATVFSFVSDGEESSRRTSTGTTPCATAMVTFLSSSWRSPNKESIAEALDSGDPIWRRVIRLRDSERMASRLETETETLFSRRRPLRKRMSQSLTWRSRVARRESRSLWVLSFPIGRVSGWHVLESETASLRVWEIEWRRWRERGFDVEAFGNSAEKSVRWVWSWVSLTRASDHFPLKFLTLGSSESRRVLRRFREPLIASVSVESFIFVCYFQWEREG